VCNHRTTHLNLNKVSHNDLLQKMTNTHSEAGVSVVMDHKLMEDFCWPVDQVAENGKFRHTVFGTRYFGGI
jgi:hypothetical protein